MKKITLALDEETYRKVRVIAAQNDTSVSALVKKFLLSLTSQQPAQRDLKQEQETLLDAIAQRYPNFTSTENLSRESLYERK